MDDILKESNPLLNPDNTVNYLPGKKKKSGFGFGLVVVFFSLIGFFSCVFFGINFIKEQIEKKETKLFNEYNSFLLAVAAVDPQAFDDIMTAPMEELVEISVWSIIGSDLEPDKYDYSTGELAIPAVDIEAAYYEYFGSSRPIEHVSVTGYGYEFSYNAQKGVYFIPLTTIEPIYTPKVYETETKGDSEILTLGLQNPNAFQQNFTTGKIEEPAPDKYVKVTLRKTGSSYYIGAIQATSLPETAAN